MVPPASTHVSENTFQREERKERGGSLKPVMDVTRTCKL